MSDQKEQQEAKFLDLDALAPEVEVFITLNGNKHKMAEMTVQDFVWAQKLASDNDKIDTDDMKDEDYEIVMGRMVDVLARQFPSCERKEIADLPIAKLTALIKFTGDLGAEGAATAIAEAAEEGKVEMVETEKNKDQ